MPELEESTPSSGIGSVVPHFYYDLIGRILPGAFVMMGAAASRRPDDLAKCLAGLKCLAEIGPTAMILGTVLFVVASYFVGFLLGAASHLIERIWRYLCPWRRTAIPGALQQTRDDQWEVRLSAENWFTIPGRRAEEVESFARICHYFVWEKSPALGAFGSKWDAEALASRSVLLGSVVLLLWGSGHFLFYQGNGLLLALFAVVAVTSGFQYSFARRNRVTSKFEMVLTLLHLEAKSTVKAFSDETKSQQTKGSLSG